MRFPAPTLLSGLLLAGAASGQQPRAEDSRASASVEVSILNLDVVVTDKKGAPVHGLKGEDFEVRLGSHLVPLSHFREERRAEAPAVTVTEPGEPAAAAPAPVEETAGPRRRIVLFFDRLALHEQWKRKELFEGLKTMLRKTLGPRDEAMIVLWERSVRAVQPFTGDMRALDHALELVAARMTRKGTEESTLNDLADLDEWFQMTSAAAGNGPSDAVSVAQNVEATTALHDMKGKTAALRSVIAALAGVDGRKALVFVSHRFSRYPGLEFFLDKRARPEDAFAASRQAFDGKTLLEELADEANAAGVTLYPLFPFALDVTFASASDPRSVRPRFNGPVVGGREQIVENNEMQALELVAERTGGEASLGRISRFADQVASDLGSYYALGIRAEKGAPAKVSVRMRQKGLEARARRSFSQKSPEERLQDRVLANLYSPDADARLPVKVITHPSAREKDGRVRLSISLGVPIGSLALLPQGTGLKGSFSVFVASVGPGGDFSGVNRKRCTLEIPEKDIARAKAGVYQYDVAILAESAESRVSVGVWDELGGDAGFALVQGGRVR